MPLGESVGTEASVRERVPQMQECRGGLALSPIEAGDSPASTQTGNLLEHISDGII